MKKAKLIVIEGGDNSGKATQTALLLERLQKEGKSVGTLDFPQYTQNTFGKLIRECLDGKRGDFMHTDARITSTLYAADRYESKNLILQLLEEKDVVVFDRYVSANMLHQGSKIADEKEREEFIQWLEHVEYKIFGLPIPDLTVALCISSKHREAILKEMVENGDKSPDLAEAYQEHQQKVSECLTWLSSTRENWSTVQCSAKEGLRSREDIHEEIYSKVIPIIS